MFGILQFRDEPQMMVKIAKPMRSERDTGA